jgi:hypothetical protein
VAESEGIFDVQVTNDELDAAVDTVKNLIMTRLRAKNRVVFILGGPVFLMVYYFFPYHDAAPCEKPRCVCPRQSWKPESRNIYIYIYIYVYVYVYIYMYILYCIYIYIYIHYIVYIFIFIHLYRVYIYINTGPGSGTGTQSALLVKKFGYTHLYIHISTLNIICIDINIYTI